MKEILFRAKDTIHGRWVYGHYVVLKNKHYIVENGDLDTLTPIIPDTLGQWTGLVDKNGVKICEGDVVRWNDGPYSDPESCQRFAAVCFLDGETVFDCARVDKYGDRENSTSHSFHIGNFAYRDTNRFVEVIGNIYDAEDFSIKLNPIFIDDARARNEALRQALVQIADAHLTLRRRAERLSYEYAAHIEAADDGDGGSFTYYAGLTSLLGPEYVNAPEVVWKSEIPDALNHLDDIRSACNEAWDKLETIENPSKI